MSVDVEALSQAVLTLLREDRGPAQRLDVFDGVVVAVADGDGRARPYAAFYASPGALGALELSGRRNTLAWGFQVTCAGGDPTRARRAIARVRARLTGAELVVGGIPVRLDEVGADPDAPAPGAPIREDRDISPSRWYAPLQFTATTTA